MSNSRQRMNAILIIGPTGSGKTPLGQLLEERGLNKRRCLHFDFGSRLRRCAGDAGALTPAEMEVVRRSLASGALLEDRDFCIARKLLEAFLEERRMDDKALVILNGLPRHTGQAEALEPYINVKLILNLECSPETALERIRLNTGGDRAGRADDTPEEVAGRARLFLERTAPLLDYYKQRGVPVMDIAISAETSAEDIYGRIATDIRSQVDL